MPRKGVPTDAPDPAQPSPFHVSALRYGVPVPLPYALRDSYRHVIDRQAAQDKAERKREKERKRQQEPQAGESSTSASSSRRLGRRQSSDDAFRRAEASYRTGYPSLFQSLALQRNVVSLSGEEEAAVQDEGWARTQARAVLLNTQSFETEAGHLDRSQLEVRDECVDISRRAAQVPLTQVDLLRVHELQSTNKGKRRKASLSKAVGSLVSIPDASEPCLLARAEIEELIERLPPPTLMETIHHIASQLYEARGLMPDKDLVDISAETKESSGESRRQKRTNVRGMERACEASALIALGVFIEELAKHDAFGQATKIDREQDQIRSEKARQVYSRLDQLGVHRMTSKEDSPRIESSEARSVERGGDASDRDDSDSIDQSSPRKKRQRGRRRSSSLDLSTWATLNRIPIG